MRPILLFCALAFFGLPGCDDKATSNTSDTADSADTRDTEDVLPPDRGPTRIPLDGDPNGLWWDAASGTLYVADDNGNRILGWTDETGSRLVAELPQPSPEGAGLGQLVKLSDGRLVVTRFGYGTRGDVVVVATDGSASVLAGLDATRRRIGLALAPDGALYTAWFTRTGQAPRVGAVGRLTLDPPSEVVVLDGLTKAVGVLATTDSLIVSDQDLKQLLVSDRNGEGLTVRATVDNPDLIAFGPEGSVFTSGSDGSVRKVSANGEVSVVASGFLSVRGVAWDEANRRLFVAEHDPLEEDGIAHVLHIVPLD